MASVHNQPLISRKVNNILRKETEHDVPMNNTFAKLDDLVAYLVKLFKVSPKEVTDTIMAWFPNPTPDREGRRSTDKKQRLRLLEVDGKYLIRYVQGHASNVNIVPEDIYYALPIDTVPTAYHNTTEAAVPFIMSYDKKIGGLRPMKRAAVHMAPTTDSVQLKDGKYEKVTITVDITAAQKAGIKFWTTTEQLDDPVCSILCLHVIPTEFVSVFEP